MIMQLAWSEVKHRPLRLVAVLLAIIIGTGFASAATVFGSTSGAAIEKSIAKPLTRADVVVRPVGRYGQQVNDSPNRLLSSIVNISGVTALAPIASMSLQLDNGSMREAEVDPGEQLRAETLASGAWPTGESQIVLGEQTARSAGLQVGQKFTVTDQTGATSKMDLVGLATEKTSTIANSAGLAIITPSFAVAHEVDSYATAIIIRSPNPAATISAISAAVGTSYVVQTGEQARTDAAKQFARGTGAISIILGTFAAIALVVASIVIVNTFTILLTQRRRQIALQRLVGASSKQIRRQILIEACILGLGGTTIGCAVGIGVAALAASLTKLDVPLQLPVAGLIVSFVIGVAVTVLSAVIPSARVMRIAPIAALRPEEASIEHAGLGRVRAGSSLALTIVGGCILGYGVMGGRIARCGRRRPDRRCGNRARRATDRRADYETHQPTRRAKHCWPTCWR